MMEPTKGRIVLVNVPAWKLEEHAPHIEHDTDEEFPAIVTATHRDSEGWKVLATVFTPWATIIIVDWIPHSEYLTTELTWRWPPRVP